MSRSPGLGSGPSTRRRFLGMTAGFVTGWATLLRHAATARAVASQLRVPGAVGDDAIRPAVRAAPGRRMTGSQPLSTVFTGTSTLTTTFPEAPGPFRTQVTIGVEFSAARDRVVITSFPDIRTLPFPTPLGSNTTTVEYVGGPPGTFGPGTGALAIPLSLRFDQSIDVPWLSYEEDSTITIPLSTSGAADGADAAPVNPTTGAATLVGTAEFQGGVLGGDEPLGGALGTLDRARGTLVLSGAFDPIPFLDNQVDEDASRPPGTALEAVLHVLMQ